jgi:hypothetical protein
VISDKDEMWALSVGWRIVIARGTSARKRKDTRYKARIKRA